MQSLPGTEARIITTFLRGVLERLVRTSIHWIQQGSSGNQALQNEIQLKTRMLDITHVH